MKILLLRILHLERTILKLKAEIKRKDQEILGLMDDRADACKRYASLLHECELEDSKWKD